MMLIRIPTAHFRATGADTNVTWQRGAANFVPVAILIEPMDIQIKAIIAEPPPASMTIRWWPSLATIVTMETAMIVVGVLRFISAYLAVGADPRIRVPVSNLRSPIPVPCALSSIPKSGPCGEYLSDNGRPLLVFRHLTFLFFGSQ